MKKLLLSLLAVVGITSWASAEEVTFDFVEETYGYPRENQNSNNYMDSPSTLDNDGAIITLTSTAGNGFRFWSDGLRLYKEKGVQMAVKTPEGTITSIEITTVNKNLSFSVSAPTTGTYAGSGTTNLSWTAGEGAEAVNEVLFNYTATANLAVKSVKVTYEPLPEMSYRRYSSDGSNRYYNYLGYTVNGETKELYSVSDPSTEDYFVAAVNGQWQTEGAYIDFKDKVIEVPADAENFTITMKSDANICSSKWSQNAVLIDWNKNGSYNDEGETNGVINIAKKPNEAGGGLVITATGDNDVITLPEGLKSGERYSMLIAMTEPKGVDGKGDLWGTQWEWTKEIFADYVCSLINGQAYELTVLITDPLETPEPAGLEYSVSSFIANVDSDNEFPTLANPNNLAITYTSSNEEVATISETGEITIVGLGTTTITATSAASKYFEAGEASYTLKVAKVYDTLADFVAANTAANDSGVINGDLTVVYANGAYVYVKDETASSLIYKYNLNYKAGDVIPGGWEGKVSIFYNLYQIVPVGTMPAATEGETPEIPVFDGTLSSDMMNQVVKLPGVVFTNATPSTKTNFTGTMGEQTINFRNNFTLPSVEAGAYDVVAAVAVYNDDLQIYPISFTPSISIVSSSDFTGTLTVDMGDEAQVEPNTVVTLSKYSDDTYGVLVKNFGASDGNPEGMGDINITGLVLEGTMLTGNVDNFVFARAGAVANIEIAGTYDETDLELHLDINIFDPFDMPIVVEFTTKESQEEPAMTYRRIYTDNSSRYYNYLGYTVNDETTELYSVSDPRTEDYYVAPLQNQWQTEGAYIDFNDKVIEVPANAENFTVIMKSSTSICSSKWSQNAVLIDWNKNGIYNEESETNGVINISAKPNTATGGKVITSEGEKDVIALPEGLNVGDTYHVLIAMTEPKGVNGNEDLWEKNWEWTKHIFTDNVCSLINGQAYGLTLKVTEPTIGITDITTDADVNAAVIEYYTIQGVKVSADNLAPGFYVARQGNKAFKILVK